jgi:hypothetical protein
MTETAPSPPQRTTDTTMPRTIVVGDIHGCLDELRGLLVKCGYQRGDRLVFAGDLIAKGPDSPGVLQLAREEGALAVIGNHDDRVLLARAVALGTAPPPEKGIRREHQRVADALTPADWGFLLALPPFLRLGPERPGDADTVVLHAGAVPGIALEKQTREHLTTMRSIDARGKPTKRIEAQPWASVWPGPERIVFGHDAVRGLQQERFAVGLDTGCVYGNRLTALILPERRLVSVDARDVYAEH